METIAKIRRGHFIDGKSIKQICRELRVSSNTAPKVTRWGATEFTHDRSSGLDLNPTTRKKANRLYEGTARITGLGNHQ